MRLPGNKLQKVHTPLRVSGSLNVAGGSVVQYFDGTNFYPNREGIPSSPILFTHQVSVYDPDGDVNITPAMNTTYYEDGVVISASTNGYELIDGNRLKVMKNIPANTQVVITAVTEFVDPRSDLIYKREDIATLRTQLKAEAQYNLTTTPHGAFYFDGYRNPNTPSTITATLKHGNEEVTDFTGIEFKWLNRNGLDVVDNELYGVSISADGQELTIDKTYIDKETIRCEAWKGGKLLGSSTATFVRKFNSYNIDIDIIGLPLQPGVNNIQCILDVTDTVGRVDVNAAFLLKWMINEDGVHRQLGTGTPFVFTRSDVNMSASTLEVYPDLKRREAFAALVDDEGNILTDDNGSILTAETYGK